MPNVRTTLTTNLFLLLYTTATLSQARPESGGGGRHHGPPPEAIDVCEGKKENAQCSFSGRGNDTVKGTCITPPGREELVCAPEGGSSNRPSRSGERD